MAIKVDQWKSGTYGGTVGEMTAYAGGESFSIVFRENGHKKVTYQFHKLGDLNAAIEVLKKGWLSCSRGK